MAKVCVSDRCALCNTPFEDGSEAVVLENVGLTSKPLIGSKIREGKIRVKRKPGTRMAWCKTCSALVFQKLFESKQVN